MNLSPGPFSLAKGSDRPLFYNLCLIDLCGRRLLLISLRFHTLTALIEQALRRPPVQLMNDEPEGTRDFPLTCRLTRVMPSWLHGPARRPVRHNDVCRVRTIRCTIM